MIAALAASFLGFGSYTSSGMDMDTDTAVTDTDVAVSTPWWFLDDGSAGRPPLPLPPLPITSPHTRFLC